MKPKREFWIDKELTEEHYDGQVTLEIKPDPEKEINFVHVVDAESYQNIHYRMRKYELALKLVREELGIIGGMTTDKAVTDRINSKDGAIDTIDAFLVSMGAEDESN